MTLFDVLSVLPHESKVSIRDTEGNVLYEGGCDDESLNFYEDRYVEEVDPVFMLTVST